VRVQVVNDKNWEQQRKLLNIKPLKPLWFVHAEAPVAKLQAQCNMKGT